ncbi:TonB-dependent receptor [Cyclobacterium qasimii]|nr:TonB-dependent receptor [Cyclobacterium qasimii]
MKISCIIGLLFICCTTSLMAQENDSLVISLEEAVVTGTRIERQKRKVAASISTISRETIARSGELNILPLIAYQVPGFFLNDRSLTGYGVGPGSGGNISIRGISGTPNNRVLVLIDGQPQYMGIFAHPIADAYNASDIERVEVQRGAASILYGSNAMGGAINLITRKATKEGWQGAANMGYGSFGTFQGTVNAAYKQDKFHSMLSLNKNSTNGFRADADDSFDNTSAYLKLGYTFSPSLALSGDVQFSDAIYYQPGSTDAPQEEDRREYLRGRAAVSLTNDWENVSGALLLFHNFGTHEFQTGFSSKDQNQGLTFFQNISLLPKQVITVGIDYKRFGGKAFNETLPPPARTGLGEQHLINETDLYIQVQQDLGERLSLNAGVRKVQNSQYGGKVLPGFGLAFQAAKNVTFKASSSKAFRSPSVVDLFLFPTSNEMLQPEELWNHEAGFQALFMDRKLEIEVMAFLAKGDNLIQVNPINTPPIGRNTGSFSNNGIESQIRFRSSELWQFVLNYAYVNASENVLFAPTHNLNFQGDFSINKFTISPFFQLIGGLRNSLQESAENENYALLNLKGMYQINPKISAYISGKNLLDEAYQLENGFPMPGVNFMTGIHLKF